MIYRVFLLKWNIFDCYICDSLVLSHLFVLRVFWDCIILKIKNKNCLKKLLSAFPLVTLVSTLLKLIMNANRYSTYMVSLWFSYFVSYNILCILTLKQILMVLEKLLFSCMFCAHVQENLRHYKDFLCSCSTTTRGSFPALISK